MKTFNNPRKFITFLSSVTRSGNNLVATLVEDARKNEMESFLKGLRTDFSFDDHIKNSFTYTYDPSNLSFTITPINATAEQIISALNENHLLPSRDPHKRPLSPRQ